MPFTFTVSKLSDWHFQFGDMDNVNVRSIGHSWEITLPDYPESSDDDYAYPSDTDSYVSYGFYEVNELNELAEYLGEVQC
ncbi:hypothetical protein CAEBREN_11880 [Caenorhabditis brenneri]|uniref:Uncharacterized protein n=1 Tax=Caenorhabditis brenneri TaxID=135651 RepID=G0PAV3_CAEBE|nr:hypothetical protein CAEBREN_11880 [Caenorhabditis brenneri]